MIKVLLVSPQDPKRPINLKHLMGGESTYTETLLGYPPGGVEYIHFREALENGLVEYLPIQKLLSFLVKFRILPISAGSQCFSIRGSFDLVHCHGYSVKISGLDIPIVISDSSSNFLYLRDYINWPVWRIKLGYVVRRVMFRWLDTVDADTNLEKAKLLVVFSNFAKKVHLNLGADKRKIRVIYPGVYNKGRGIKVNDGGDINILFVGVWFERKGGRLLIEAYAELSKKYSNLKLTIIGPVPSNIKLSKNIQQVDFVPREKLMREYFPKADVLVLVPLKAEGLGFVVLEAMSFGIPAIVSDIYALSEIVENGKTGFVVTPERADELKNSLEVLINNKSSRIKMGKAAEERYRNNFSVDVMNKKLFKVYQEALGIKG